MSLKSLLRSATGGADASTVTRLEQKVADAQVALAAAQSEAAAAALEAEENDTAATRAKADKAQSVAVATKARLETLTGALREARARAAKVAEAEAMAQRQKDAREAAAKRTAAFDQADAAGQRVEKAIADLADAAREALAAQRELQPYFSSNDFGTQMLNAHLGFHACVTYHTRFVPGASGGGLTLDVERAHWTKYLPSTVLPRGQKVAA